MKRRAFAKTAGAAAGIGAFPFLQIRAAKRKRFVVGDRSYELEEGWSKVDHATTPLKDCHEMVCLPSGELVLLTNEPKNNVIIFDTAGRLVTKWTLSMAGAHGLSLGGLGNKPTLWITDTRGRIVEVTLEGEILREMPSAAACGAYRADQPYRPTETCLGPDGSAYVIDGYGSQFILKFSAEGAFQKKFGGKSTQPKNQGRFMQAHGIALDTRGKTPLLVCTGRIRNEFTWFTMDGEYVRSVYLPGAFVSRPVIIGEELWSGVCFGFLPNDYRMWQGRGFVLGLDRYDRPMAALGAQPLHCDGEGVLQSPLMKADDGPFTNVHDVCADKQGNLYACQWNSGKTPPFKLHLV